MVPLEEKIKNLPPEFQQEVERFIDDLLAHGQRNPPRPLKQNWAGALKLYRHQYTAIELQKKALGWRL